MADGFYLSESVSIVEYLDAQFGPTPLVGTTPAARATTSMWVSPHAIPSTETLTVISGGFF